jgi:hypothetical protein
MLVMERLIQSAIAASKQLQLQPAKLICTHQNNATPALRRIDCISSRSRERRSRSCSNEVRVVAVMPPFGVTRRRPCKTRFDELNLWARFPPENQWLFIDARRNGGRSFSPLQIGGGHLFKSTIFLDRTRRYG